MDKKTKYAGNGALIGGIIKAAINTYKQLNENNQTPNKSFDWWELFGETVKGAAIGGGAGLLLGAIVDNENSQQNPINTDAFLFAVINDISLDKNDPEYKWLDNKAHRLVEILKKEFNDKLQGEPIRLGSTEKGTALSDSFDIDICLSFKPNSFSSTEEMYSRIMNIMENLKGTESIVKIREQRKSIGVILERRGHEYKIDIVPYKLTKTGKNSTAGYLYVNGSEKSSFVKTDVHALNSLKLSETQKKIVIVLKHWKNTNDIPLSSHLLENLVLDAYDRNPIPRQFTQKVIMVLRHIRDKLNVAVIRGVENSNNILTNISDSKKATIISACKVAIEDYEYHPNKITELFGN